MISADVVSDDGVRKQVFLLIKVATMLSRVYDVETTCFTDANTFDWAGIAHKMVASSFRTSTVRIRYNQHAPNLETRFAFGLVESISKPDIAAPALITYGFAPPAIDAGGSMVAR